MFSRDGDAHGSFVRTHALCEPRSNESVKCVAKHLREQSLVLFARRNVREAGDRKHVAVRNVRFFIEGLVRHTKSILLAIAAIAALIERCVSGVRRSLPHARTSNVSALQIAASDFDVRKTLRVGSFHARVKRARKISDR